ncbi:hypothetical protein PMY38_13670 [Clostridium tertium]|jgi:hypothetical protein|uniref:hypothetical protein n=1 Tax=Clostridium TaxID=1485 RepID=UPI0013EEF3A3|nr:MULTISPECIES: hypothetical protein [Clostridium]MDB1939182.1 hypothetical protein [Clostridium tertium]MDB1947651.1 hypothetical protein [Clostridium tertium]MDB1956351.1 hypothetical protein [Clostridium tertium]MDB1959647.1 hypothetical protein [Clostridium tertium]MDB1961557.1 hypothetical protein [Clostridium tertium]
MYEVTLILPEDTKELEDKFAEVMADIVSNKLTHEELGVLIDKLENLDKVQL